MRILGRGRANVLDDAFSLQCGDVGPRGDVGRDCIGRMYRVVGLVHASGDQSQEAIPGMDWVLGSDGR